MYVTILVGSVMLIWMVGTFLIDAWRRRRLRPDLTERLRPSQLSIADEAESWLRRRG